MSQLIDLPDGTTAEFPDNMATSDIESVLQKQFPAPSAQASTDQSPGLAFARGAITGAAAIPDLVPRALDAMGVKNTAPFEQTAGAVGHYLGSVGTADNTWAGAQAQSKADYDQSNEQYPKETTAGELVGSAPAIAQAGAGLVKAGTGAWSGIKNFIDGASPARKFLLGTPGEARVPLQKGVAAVEDKVIPATVSSPQQVIKGTPAIPRVEPQAAIPRDPGVLNGQVAKTVGSLGIGAAAYGGLKKYFGFAEGGEVGVDNGSDQSQAQPQAPQFANIMNTINQAQQSGTPDAVTDYKLQQTSAEYRGIKNESAMDKLQNYAKDRPKGGRSPMDVADSEE